MIIIDLIIKKMNPYKYWLIQNLQHLDMDIIYTIKLYYGACQTIEAPDYQRMKLHWENKYRQYGIVWREIKVFMIILIFQVGNGKVIHILL